MLAIFWFFFGKDYRKKYCNLEPFCFLLYWFSRQYPWNYPALASKASRHRNWPAKKTKSPTPKTSSTSIKFSVVVFEENCEMTTSTIAVLEADLNNQLRSKLNLWNLEESSRTTENCQIVIWSTYIQMIY